MALLLQHPSHMSMIQLSPANLSPSCGMNHRPVRNPKQRESLLGLFAHTDNEPPLTLECLYTLHDRDIKASVITVSVDDNINIFRYLQRRQRFKKHLGSQSAVLPGDVHLDRP